jgi:hypothetical protein
MKGSIKHMENLSTVNAGPVGNVEPQEPIVNEPVNAGDEGIANPQNDSKPAQTPDQNHEFATIRKEAETKAKDAVIAELGYEYKGKPITTYAEYQQALKDVETEQQNAEFEQQNGISPDAIKPLFEQWKESDPDFQELKSIRAEKNATTALSDLNKELEDAGLDLKLNDLSDAELNKIPNIEKVTELMQTRRLSLAEAFFIANKNDIISGQVSKVQQETIKKISANGGSSPGSLSGGGEVGEKSIYSLSKDDFKKMQEEVMRGERKSL